MPKILDRKIIHAIVRRLTLQDSNLKYLGPAWGGIFINSIVPDSQICNELFAERHIGDYAVSVINGQLTFDSGETIQVVNGNIVKK